MSRWSTNSLRLALAPGEIALLRPDGVPASRSLTTRESGLRGLLPLLEEALADPEWQLGRVEIVVSQHFVRHVVTPAPGKALSRAEEHALVKSSLESIYGETAADWRLDVISQPPQFGLLGAAMDAGFLSQLEHMLAHYNFVDISIHPLASLAARHLPGNFSGWWILAEPGWLNLFGGTGRTWQHISAQPIDANWTARLPGLVARETELAPAPPPKPLVWLQPIGTGPVAAPAGEHAVDWRMLPHNHEARGALALLEI